MPFTQRESVASPPDTEDTIVLAMREGRDRELLSGWLASLPRYRVETAVAPAGLPEEYDLCLLDAPLLEQFRAELERRHDQSASVFLPHMLIVHGGDATTSRRHLSADTDELFDDILQFPLEKELLHRRLENALRARRAAVTVAERERQYRQLVELSPEAVLIVSDTTIVYANQAAGSLFDTHGDDLVGCSVLEFVAADGDDMLQEVLDAAQNGSDASGREFVELQMTSVTGRELYVSVAGVTVVSDGQERTQLILRDLTTEKERKQRLNLFGRAMESAAQGITIADAEQPDYPLIYANVGFERITGYPIGEVLGQNCRFLQGANTRQETVDKIRTAIEAERSVSVDILNYRRDGTPFWNRLDIVPVENEEGEVTHYLGLQRDVTDQKEREQQLSVMNRVLRHNLRNKMNVIQVYAEQLQELPAAADAASSIEKASEELLTISEQIRKFDSILAADRDDLCTVDLVALVRQRTDDICMRYPDADIDLTVPDEALVSAHETLEPALIDLLTPTETVDTPRVDIDLAVEETTVVLRITDYDSLTERGDLEVVARDRETQLEHLESLELWLIRWAVEESRGEFMVDIDATNPELTMRFQRADPEDG